MIVINYVSVLAAAVAAFVIGWLWYGPLFGKAWMRERGMDPAAMAGMPMPMGKLVGEFLAGLVTAYVLARFVSLHGVIDWQGGLHLAFWIWLGFYAMFLLGAVLWEKASWNLYAINAGRWLVTLIAMTAILGTWR